MTITTNQATNALDAPAKFFYVSVPASDESNAESDLMTSLKDHNINQKSMQIFLVHHEDAENDEELGIFVYAVYDVNAPEVDEKDEDMLSNMFTLTHLVDARYYVVDDFIR